MFPVSVTCEQEFLKVMEERLQYLFILQSCRVNSIMCIVMYEKVVLLEISRNSLLTRVRRSQSTGCNTNSQSNFLKMFRKAFKILKNSGNNVHCGVPFSRSRSKKVLRKACKCTSKVLQHGCSTEKLLNIFETAIF